MTDELPKLTLADLAQRAKALAAEAQREAAAKAEATSNRRRLGDSRLTPEEREKLLLKLREWEQVHDYDVTALVFRVQRWFCACGLTVHGHGQVFLLEQHRRIATTKRYVRVPNSDTLRTDLPRHQEWEDGQCRFCFVCAGREGFK